MSCVQLAFYNCMLFKMVPGFKMDDLNGAKIMPGGLFFYFIYSKQYYRMIQPYFLPSKNQNGFKPLTVKLAHISLTTSQQNMSSNLTLDF